MKLMEEVFFSFTFGGETLSLAASLATMQKLQREPVIATMTVTGEAIQTGLRETIAHHGAGHILGVAGHPTWSFLTIQDAGGYAAWEIKSLYLQEMFARGVLSLATHNISYAHSSADVTRLLAVYGEVIPILCDAVGNHHMKELLRCEPLKPLFKVR